MPNYVSFNKLFGAVISVLPSCMNLKYMGFNFVLSAKCYSYLTSRFRGFFFLKCDDLVLYNSAMQYLWKAFPFTSI